MQSILHNKHTECLQILFADVGNMEQEEMVLYSVEWILADSVLVPRCGSETGHREECFVRGGSETPKWLVMGMSQGTFHRDL